MKIKTNNLLNKLSRQICEQKNFLLNLKGRAEVPRPSFCDLSNTRPRYLGPPTFKISNARAPRANNIWRGRGSLPGATGKRFVKRQWIALTVLGLGLLFVGAQKKPAKSEMDINTALEKMKELGFYKGPSVPGVDCSTMLNKVVVGYQGWHNAEGDGAGNGWRHYEFNKGFGPGHVCLDFWPDTSEFDADEKYITPFKKEDGSPAYAFSAYNPKTVKRHMEWMRDYGIDAAFVQRFTGSMIKSPNLFNNFNTVLRNVRDAANQTGRGYIVMYDLSGLPGDALEAAKEDWRRLVKNMGITRDPGDKAYMHHRGKPLVAVWGVGMDDKAGDTAGKRAFDFERQKQLIDFLQNDPEVGGCAIMLGTPTAWRTLDRDSIKDPGFHDLIKKVEILSPWTPGRYNNPDKVKTHAANYWKGDLEWCKANGVDYLPVVFPGFSWTNKKPDSKLNSIPRLGGKFLWAQYAELKKLGVNMVYQAMFDEMDEGTQIFKVDPNPPVGSPFLWNGYDENVKLPSDHYLWLVGEAAKMIRGQLDLSEAMPKRNH